MKLSDIIERGLELQCEQAAEVAKRMQIELDKLHRLLEEDDELRVAVRLWTAGGRRLDSAENRRPISLGVLMP